MTISIRRRVMRKDLHLAGGPALLYLVCGLAAVALMCVRGLGFLYAGSVLLATALVILGVHPAVMTIVEERKNQTLAFTMSLPISPGDYTWAKLVANLLAFFVPWLVLWGAACAAIALRPGLPDGLIPVVTVLMLELAVNAVLILCVALVTESLDWVIRTLILCNLAFQGAMFALANHPPVKAAMAGDVADWSPLMLALIAIELLIMAAALVMALRLQARKTDFV